MGITCSCPDCCAHHDPDGYDCPQHSVRQEAVDRLRQAAEQVEQNLPPGSAVVKELRDIADLLDT